jgi:hypothetical protein
MVGRPCLQGHPLDHLNENTYDVTDRDRPLSFHWRTVDFVHLLGLPLAHNRAYDATRSAILAEAILAAEVGHGVSYSRRRGFYSEGRRYRGTSFTYASVMAAIAGLDRAGWISDCRVAPGNRGWQSSFVATDQLMQAWRSALPQVAYTVGETVWLKNDDGDLIDYRDTRDILRIKRALAQANESLASLRIEIPNVEWRGRHMLIDGSYVLPIPGNGLRRIFSRGSWSLHGRAYGWFQAIPKTARPNLRINGEPVAEADYGSLHASILYNEAGIKFTGDAYEVAGFDRAEIKLGFNIALNAKNTRAAVAALADHLDTGRRRAADIITAIQHRHKSIERQFCADTGVRLMRIDSELILDALRGMNDAGDPALPIHDALVVPARCADQAEDKMVESFERIVGRVNPCTIKIKSRNVPHTGIVPPGSSASPLASAA